MKRFFSFVVFAGAVTIACGGATSTNLDGPGDGGANDGSATDASTLPDGAPRPRFEDLVTCSGPGTCVLGAKGCCGLGCQPDNELVAIRRSETENLKLATCDTTGPVACPKCARLPGGNTQAFCTTGKCTVVDLRKDPLSACEKDEDCVLRYGTCCQSCSGGSIDSLVSIKKGNEAALEAQICAGTEGCDKCLPVFPPGVRARCNSSGSGGGHCDVQKP